MTRKDVEEDGRRKRMRRWTTKGGGRIRALPPLLGEERGRGEEVDEDEGDQEDEEEEVDDEVEDDQEERRGTC